jgi:hypothetical protein
MKKLILCLIIVLNFSCEEKKEFSSSEYPKPFSLRVDENLGPRVSGIVMGSDGHDYLIINTKYYSSGVDHYIDCKLCQTRDSLKK